MKRIDAYLEDYQIESLRKLATERVNFSEHIRRAIDRYLLYAGAVSPSTLEAPSISPSADAAPSVSPTAHPKT